MKKYILILLTMVAYTKTEAQAVYNIDDVDHLHLYSNYIHFLKKENDSLYTVKYLTKVNPLSIYQINQKKTIDELSINNTIIIPVNDLFPVAVDEWIAKFQNKEYIVSGGIKKDGFIMTLEMIYPNIWVERLYNNFDRENNRWRSHHSSIIYMHFISLPNGTVYMQGTGNYYIIPYKSSFLAGFGETGELNEIFNYKKYFPNKLTYSYERLKNINSQNFYSIEKNSKQNYELKDKLGNNLLQQNGYDTIYTNRYFIVGQHGTTYDIYNNLLQSVKKDVDGFNFLKLYVQYIQNNKLYTINVNGETDISYTELSFRCGSVPHYQYKLQKNEKGEFLLIEHSDSKHIIGNTDDWDTITFLNGHNEIFYDSNNWWDLIHNVTGVGYDWVITEKNGKLSLCRFVSVNGSYSIQKILPTEYDKIEFRSFYEPVTLHRNGLQQVCANIYDSQNFGNTLKLIISPPFKTIEEQHRYFLRYKTEKGEKGWYDIQKGVCIIDKK